MSVGSSAAPEEASDLLFPTWRVRNWQHPVSYLPAVPPHRARHSRGAGIALALVLVITCVLLGGGILFSVSGHTLTTAVEGSVGTLLLVGSSTAAVVLRYRGVAARHSRVLFVASAIALLLLSAALLGTPGVRAVALVPFAYLILSTALWCAFGPAATRQRLDRSRYCESRDSDLSGELDSRIHRAYDVEQTTALPQSDNEYEHFDLYDAYSEPVDAYAINPVFEQLLQIPSVHIVHGIGSNTPGAYDRAVAFVAGNRIALLDNAHWDASRYLQSRFAAIVSPGFARAPQISLGDNVVERIAGRIPEAEVWGWITTDSHDADVALITPSDLARRTSVAEVSTAVEEIGQWLADGGTTVNLLVLRDVLASRKY